MVLSLSLNGTQLIAFKDKQLIKVVTGIRRCWKSTLLEIYQNWLLEQGIEKEQIISINFEDIDFEELTDYRRLYSYLKERLVPGKVTYWKGSRTKSGITWKGFTIRLLSGIL